MELEGFQEREVRPYKLKSLLIGVLLPSLIALFYYQLIASDQYESEVRFVVRNISVLESDGDEEGGGLSVGRSQLTQDAHLVADYIESLDLVAILDDELDLRSHYSDPKIDWFSRLAENSSNEDLLNHWEAMTSTYVDAPSGIIVVSVRAFDAQKAQELAQRSLEAASDLINDLSQRAAGDLVNRALAEVEIKQTGYQEALTALQVYQNEVGILDPVTAARSLGETVAELTGEKIKAETQLFVLQQSNAENSATARQLAVAVETLDAQIAELRNRMAGNRPTDTDQPLSEAMIRFSSLEADRLIAEALYEAARKSLNIANTTALRKTAYVSAYSGPTLATKSEFPRRLETPFVIFAGLFMIWATGILLWASVEDHRE